MLMHARESARRKPRLTWLHCGRAKRREAVLLTRLSIALSRERRLRWTGFGRSTMAACNLLSLTSTGRLLASLGYSDLAGRLRIEAERWYA